MCGCAVTAEIKKNKYIYYHCTGYKGNCKQPYVRQEIIEDKFAKPLENIQVSEEMQKIILDGMRESLKDKIEYHNNCIQHTEKQIKVLQNRIDQAYLDKLDGKISEVFWQTHSKQWLMRKEDLAITLLNHQKADSRYLENATIVFELVQKAATLFKCANIDQKRALIKLLVSNCSYKDKKLDIELRSPFNTILKTTKSKDWCAR